MPVSRHRIAAIVLAAGRSSRMGHFKLLADLAGKPMVRWVVEAVCGGAVSQVVVVTGNEAEAVARVLDGLDVQCVHNPDYAEGLSTSLATGLSALAAHTDGVVILLGDMPQVTTAAIDALVDAFEPDHVIVPVHEGKSGNPILWPREAFARMAVLSGDAGARKLLPDFADRVREVEIDSRGIFEDIDTPQALAALRARLGQA